MIANITITNDITTANAITHGGIFHADEVFGTIILSKVMDNIVLARTFKVPEDIADDVIVYDIGGGDFDHHQLGGNGTRADGIPYASCGLLWHCSTPLAYEYILYHRRGLCQTNRACSVALTESRASFVQTHVRNYTKK